MSNPVVRRYAQALLEEAQRQGAVEQVDEDVNLIRESLASSGELERFFRSPVIPRDKKKTVVERLFKGRVSPLTHRFMQLLIDKERETLFASVAEAYRAQRDREQGIVEAQARTARSLDEDEKQKLVRRLEQMTGKTVRLQTTQEEALIGGLIVRVGDMVYDGSVAGQLASLRERLAQGVSAPQNGHGESRKVGR